MNKIDWDKEIRDLGFKKSPYGVKNAEYHMRANTLHIKLYDINDYESLEGETSFKDNYIFLDFSETLKSQDKIKEFILTDKFKNNDYSNSLYALALYVLSSRTLFKLQNSSDIKHAEKATNIRNKAIEIVNLDRISLDTPPIEIDINLIFDEISMPSNQNVVTSQNITTQSNQPAKMIQAPQNLVRKNTAIKTYDELKETKPVDDLKPFAGLM